MIGVGLASTLSGGKKIRTNLDPMPALDLNFAVNRSLPADYGPTPSFSRASSGTYFDSSGTLRTAATNVARFDHVYSGGGWVSRGLLLEEQRTNSAQYSEDFTNAYWTKAGLSVAGNVGVAPDGNTTADRFVETAANSQHTLYNSGFSVTSGTAYTISFFAKAAGRNFIQFQSANALSGTSGGVANFDLANGVMGTVSGTNTYGEIVNVGNGWYRCIIRVASAYSNGTGYLQLTLIDSATATAGQAYLGDGASGALVWGIQLEAGSSFATSYIPSLSSSSTTRSADVCQITGSDFSSFWNATEGSFAFEYDRIGNLTSAFSQGYPYLAEATDGTVNNRIIFSAYYTGPTENMTVQNGGVNQAAIAAGSSPSANISTKSAACYKLNDFAMSLNGAAVVTDTSGTVPTCDRFSIGNYWGGGYILNGHIARLRYYPTRLTNAKLQELST